jgi:glycosyltransferase involved in cell wall biosynthesis
VRIVQLANFYGPATGGLRTAVDALGRGYVAAGLDRALIVPGPDWSVDEGVDGTRCTVAARRVPGGSPYRVITDLTSVRALLDELAPDRLEISDKLTLHRLTGWARDHDVPTVLISHERLDAVLSPRVPLRRAIDQWNRRLVGAFDAVVCASAFAAAEFERVGATHVVRSPLGVDLSLFHPDARGGRPMAGSADLHLVCVGRLSREKRPDVALDALRHLLDAGVPARLTFVGDGPSKSRLLEAAGRLPVTFTGHLRERVGVAVLLAQADVALAPGPYETFGLSALEALACGTPVVVADTGASPELLGRAPVGIAAAYDGRAFASAARALTVEPVEARREAARRRAERYPWSRTVAALLELHTRLGDTAARRAS